MMPLGLGAHVPVAGDTAKAEAAPLPSAPPGVRGWPRPGGGRGTCVGPRVGPEVARLVEARPTLHADEVSLAGLRPERPWAAVAVGGVQVGRRQGRGREENIISLSNSVMGAPAGLGDDQQTFPRLC